MTCGAVTCPAGTRGAPATIRLVVLVCPVPQLVAVLGVAIGHDRILKEAGRKAQGRVGIAARAALPQLVRRDQLEVGNSLISTQEVVGQSFLGAPVGALLFAATAAAPLFGNAAGFALAAVLVLTIRQRLRPQRTEKTSIRTDLHDGLRWTWQHHFVRGLTLLTAMMAVGLYMVIAVQVLYVLETLGLSEATYGLIMIASGAGAVVGGLAAPWISARLGRSTTLVLAAVSSALATMALGLMNNPFVAGTLFGLTALAGTVWDVLSLSLRQAIIPAELFGRVQGSYRTLAWGAIPIGALAGGALATATTIPTVFMTAGMINMVVGVGVWRLVHAHRDQIATAFSERHNGSPTSPAHGVNDT